MPPVWRTDLDHVAELLLPTTNLWRHRSCAITRSANTLPDTTNIEGAVSKPSAPDPADHCNHLTPTMKGPVHMRRGILAVAAVGLLAIGGLAACGDDAGDDAGAAPTRQPKIGVILPDSKSSARWETADRKYLEEAFKAAGVEYDIQNAQNDKTAVPDHRRPDDHQRRHRPDDRQPGLRHRQGRARQGQGARASPTIDYDRLTLGGRRRLLRQLRQRGRRQAPGRGPGQVPDRRRT